MTRKTDAPDETQAVTRKRTPLTVNLAALTFQDEDALPTSNRGGVEYTEDHPLVVALADSWNNDRPKSVIVPADQKAPVTSQIRAAATTFGKGARVRYADAGDGLVKIIFKAAEKRARKPKGDEQDV